MTDLTDEQFNQEVAALEKELAEGSQSIAKRIKSLEGQLNADFAEADKTLGQFQDEIENGGDE